MLPSAFVTGLTARCHFNPALEETNCPWALIVQSRLACFIGGRGTSAVAVRRLQRDVSAEESGTERAVEGRRLRRRKATEAPVTDPLVLVDVRSVVWRV